MEETPRIYAILAILARKIIGALNGICWPKYIKKTKKCDI